MKGAQFYVLSLGSYIVAGAHYIRDGGDGGWYVVWCLTGAAMAVIGGVLSKANT